MPYIGHGETSPVFSVKRLCLLPHYECGLYLLHREDAALKNSSCLREGTACEMAACACDRSAAECFARHPWNPKHKRYSFWDILA
nr:acidic phospholipase A2 1-like [Penaeus vannamei]